MTLSSPVLAMLWENWRLTRKEIVWRLALGIVAASAALVAFAAMAAIAANDAVNDLGALVALILVVLPHMMGWFSINTLNIGRPGFPFYLLYSRPVRTTVAVAVAMTYWTAVPAALYLVSAFLLRITSGYAFPLLPVAAWVAGLNVSGAAVNWSIRNVFVRTLGHAIVGVAWTGLAMRLLTVEDLPGPDLAPPHLWPIVFDWPFTYYGLIGAVGLVSFGLTVAAVARQRRGGTSGAIQRKLGFADISPFRFPCPLASATRAQVWFELRSSGLPLLTIGVALAIANPLLFAAGVSIDAVISDGFRQYVKCRVDGCFYGRAFALMLAMFSVPAMLVFAGNAFGIRSRQGRVYASAFEATQPYKTGRLAGVKVVVRSVSLFSALAAVVGSAWASGLFLAVGDVFLGPQKQGPPNPLRSWQGAIEGAVGALTGYEQIALIAVAAFGVAVMVASLATFSALAARYPRRVGIVVWVLLFHGLVFVPLVLTGYSGVGSAFLWEFLDVLMWVARWIETPAIVLATVYAASKAISERLLTFRDACGAVLVSAAFGAAWLTMLRAVGVSLSEMSAMNAVAILSPALLPLMASVLAPWSLSRIRHT